MESTAIDTIRNISDVTLLMTYVKQKIHTNIFLNFVKHLVVYFALELWIYRHSVFCNKMDECIFFLLHHKRDKPEQTDTRPQDQIYHIMYINVMPYQSYYEHSAQFQFLTDEQIDKTNMTFLVHVLRVWGIYK